MREEFDAMLRELLEVEEEEDYFRMTSRERREFQQYVERLIERGTDEEE